MSTIVLLSSSPPPVFAQSPTSIRSSSPFHSSAVPLHGHSPGKGRFRVKEVPRDGFSPSFSTARQVLAQKNGTENVLNKSLGKNKFRSSQEKLCEESDDKELSERWRKTKSGSNTRKVKTVERIESLPRKEHQDGAKVIGEDDILPAGDTEKSMFPESLLLERAVARRLDWTPPKAKFQESNAEKPVEYSAGFLNGMLSDFKYADGLKSEAPIRNDRLPNPPKRRRIEHLKEDKTKATVPSIPGSVATKPDSTKSKSKANRSPAKKPLTITGLATSNYLGDSDAPESSIVQYLMSTQAQLNNTSTDPALETEVKRTKAAANKIKNQRKKQPKSLLVSPKTAMQTYDEQEAIFGSASQLAQEESPAFLREVIEATKQSESFLMSDLLSSPQRTQMASVEHTPKAGITRLQRTRNLWSAAGRDEDNALLHIDTIDLTDTPAVRAAFAGKDVMLQPGTISRASVNRSMMSLSGGFSPLREMGTNEVIDISDINTPSLIKARAFSSTTKPATPRKSPVRIQLGENDQARVLKPEESKGKEAILPKPNYAGLTTRELNKQITSFGFKAMRKREKMIELLDRCWEEKHGPSTVVEVEPEAVPYGNFLSNVHDVSERPQPKAKKAVTRKKKSTAETENGSAKKPRGRRKKVEVEDDAQQKPKVPRKRKSKASLDVQESILDVDQLWDRVPEELRALETFDDWAKPARKPKTKTSAAETIDTETSALPPPLLPTPPATLPAASTTQISVSSSDDTPAAAVVVDVVDVASTTPATPNTETASTPTSSLPSLSSQITSAIMRQSSASSLSSALSGSTTRRSPTWHEKILLYDPIILEDLALWLNTGGGLGAIGEDREVGVLDVRAWCEERGLCCLHRGGWRGNKLDRMDT